MTVDSIFRELTETYHDHIKFLLDNLHDTFIWGAKWRLNAMEAARGEAVYVEAFRIMLQNASPEQKAVINGTLRLAKRQMASKWKSKIERAKEGVEIARAWNPTLPPK